ncbi:MAG: class I SAM-dependent methyltransferase [Candidatus Thermoplasmatota archaeon]|nr:class I SAM-dependent methyltransferase [Candidatus Thermoplasmatota archaeon]
MNDVNISNHRRHWIKLGFRALKFYMNQSDKTYDLVKTGYNKVAKFYDSYWTQYMHSLSEDMLTNLDPPIGGKSLDLTCGTGFVTSKLFEISDGDVTGVDSSDGMINIAQKNYGHKCRFIQSEVLDFLKKQPSNSYDIITCAWGLGYLPASKLIKEISRVLHPGGRIGIIDNSTFSNWEPIWFLFVAFAEEPNAFKYSIRPRFLPTPGVLTRRMRLNGIKVIDSWKGKKIYKLAGGKKAMEQYIRSGAAAGIVQIIDDKYEDKIINRVGELLQKYYGSKDVVPIIHRYIAAVGVKK